MEDFNPDETVLNLNNEKKGSSFSSKENFKSINDSKEND